jgi:hypothetical protein
VNGSITPINGTEKITANSTSYGVLARLDRRNYVRPQPIVIYGPDESPIETSTQHPEDPGPYCGPPWAAAITGGARLLLAMIERLVTDAGGAYAFCDTDSFAVVTHRDGIRVPCETADGRGYVQALTPTQVTPLLERFETLNPFQRRGLWKPVHDSFEQENWTVAISAKRYVVYRLTSVGRPGELVDWSEHGLGMYLDPLADEHGDSDRDDEGRLEWTKQAWRAELHALYELPAPSPAWEASAALSRFAASSPATARLFDGYNRARPHTERMRPFSFGMLGHVDVLLGKHDQAPKPAAAYQPNPRLWLTDTTYYDRGTGDQVAITTASPVDRPSELWDTLADGGARLQTLGDAVRLYFARPEHKSLAPDGSPVVGTTRGQLRRRPVRGAPALTHLVGKEANDIKPPIGELPGTSVQHYGRRASVWDDLVLPVLRLIGAQEVARRARLDVRTLQRCIRLDDPTMPHPRHRQALHRIAVAEARDALAALGRAVAGDGEAALYAYLGLCSQVPH